MNRRYARTRAQKRQQLKGTGGWARVAREGRGETSALLLFFVAVSGKEDAALLVADADEVVGQFLEIGCQRRRRLA